MINDLPTIFEVVTGNVKQPKEQSATQNSSKSKSSGKTVRRHSFTEVLICFIPFVWLLCVMFSLLLRCL